MCIYCFSTEKKKGLELVLITAMTYLLAVNNFDGHCNLQTKASQVVVRICRSMKQAERDIWTKNRIHKGDMVPIRSMDLEVVQWEASELCAIAFISMLAMSIFEPVHPELGTISPDTSAIRIFKAIYFVAPFASVSRQSQTVAKPPLPSLWITRYHLLLPYTSPK